MYSICLTSITNSLNYIETEKRSPLTSSKPHITIPKVVAHSYFKPTRVYSSSRNDTPSKNETSPTQPNTTLSNPMNIFKSIITEFSDMVFSYSTAITSSILDPPLHPLVDPKHVLTGNFAPVGETPPTGCVVVEGELPPSLNGTYIRNGPNPQHQPHGPHHLWSGDGMLHSVRVSNGRAIFCSRYVKTLKYELESAKGSAIIPNFISGLYGLNDMRNAIIGLGRAMIQRVNLVEALGVANTSLAFFRDSLFALADAGLPYKIQLTSEGNIETLHRYDFGKNAPLNMTAHPKIDPETGEIFAFQLHIMYPYLTFFRYDATRASWDSVPISSLNRMCFVHDFAITQNYVIFFDTQLEFSFKKLILCKGIPLSYQPTKVSRIGVLSRHAISDSDIRWFPVPGFNGFHILNAWEEDNDQIVIITPTILSPDDVFYKVDGFHSSLEKLRVDMKTSNVSRTILSDQVLEMGSINPSYSGIKNRYVYMAIHGSSLKMSGVMKIDLELGCEIVSRYYGKGCFGGEALFVRASDENDPHLDEDGGFVMTYMHDEMTNESYFIVMDAKTLEYIAKLKLPGRVPYGLHGLFLNEKQLSH